MKHMNDALLLPRLQQGDLQVLKIYFLRLYRPLCLKAGLMLGNLKAAEMLVQQVFREVWITKEYLHISAPVADFFYTRVHAACELNDVQRAAYSVHDT